MTNGGKALSLKKLSKAGFLVPKFFVCKADWNDKKIMNTVSKQLPRVNYFAIRSSAKNEDSKSKSYAGHFYSAIGVNLQDVNKEVKKVRTSFNQLSGEVIIQEFIPTERSGVLFTKIDGNKTIINATFGLCQPVVNGKACDEYIYNSNQTLLSKSINNKKIQIFKNEAITEKSNANESLSNQQQIALINTGIKIEKFFKLPQDIEWGFYKEKLYILQSRPITKDFSTSSNTTYFDSANIAESYSGVVLPLTQSFAKKVYSQIYKDLLHNSGVSNKIIKNHTEIFDNLLAFFYGHMYYNMNNWYLLAAFVPGYHRNKQNFELMITSNIKQEISTDIKPHLFLKIFYPSIILLKIIKYPFDVLFFKKTVTKELNILFEKSMNESNYKESITLFENINKKLLRKWYIAVENDFFVMTYLGILKKLVNDKQLQNAISFPSKSTEQVIALKNLSINLYKNKLLWQTIENNNQSKFKLLINNESKISDQLNNYFKTFGGRFANELKLESISMDEDLNKLFSVLKAYRNYTPKKYKKTRQKILLPFPKNIFFSYFLSKFKKHASLREEFRLLRSNTFGMSRKLFRHMGEILVEKNIIKNVDDVFYLKLEELFNSKTQTNKNIMNIIIMRKKEFNTYKKVTPPTHFATTNNKPPQLNNKNISKTQKTIFAKPSSPGVIIGKVKIFKEFAMPSKIDFDILVTAHTDPGWTALIALSKGLIIENGGVLSHASIVARELNIPAVIGAENAMQILKDNQMVEINGETGTIKIL